MSGSPRNDKVGHAEFRTSGDPLRFRSVQAALHVRLLEIEIDEGSEGLSRGQEQDRNGKPRPYGQFVRPSPRFRHSRVYPPGSEAQRTGNEGRTLHTYGKEAAPYSARAEECIGKELEGKDDL